VRARCERTAVERCRALFGETADYGSVMAILFTGVRRGRVVHWVCKPEVTGSIPVRSIADLQGFSGSRRRTRAARVPEMAAPWQRASGVRGLGDDTEPVLEHPSPRLIALVLAERAHVVARPDLGRVPGDLGRLGGVDAAGGRRSSRTTSAGASA
jgi:hypothetical protein